MAIEDIANLVQIEVSKKEVHIIKPKPLRVMRKINNAERVVLEYLVKQSSMKLPKDWSENLLIHKMDDGGMGSFKIFQNQFELEVIRKFGKQAAEYQFIDDDGVPVFVTLYLDDQNRLFEVDVWKINYIPVINLKVPS